MLKKQLDKDNAEKQVMKQKPIKQTKEILDA